jgi:hypothetical protein
MQHLEYGMAILCLACAATWSLSGCSTETGRQGDAGTRRYAENVEVDLRLGPSGDVIDFTKEDFLFTVTNKGPEVVTELIIEITFLDGDGVELGRTRWLLVGVDERMERMVDADKKVKHRPLLPGHTIKLNTDVVHLFAGESGLRDKVVNQWDNLTTEVSILRVVTQDTQEAWACRAHHTWRRHFGCSPSASGPRRVTQLLNRRLSLSTRS